MYPNITLVIENNVPKIIFFPEEGMSRNLTQQEENLEEIFLALAKTLELESFDDIHKSLELAYTGDERFLEVLPDPYVNQFGFGINEFIKQQVDKALKDMPDFEENTGVSLAEEVVKELQRNYKTDVFASIVEQTFNAIILKILATASELGIGKIRIENKSNLIRLTEKLASELTKIGIELDID